MNVPCRDCTDRELGCHGKCERYMAYREELNAQTRERKADEKRNSMLNDFYVDGVTKSIKRQGRKI